MLDLGAGGGLVAIAAARAGAAHVLAAETDPLARTALALNAEANGVPVTVEPDDLLDAAPPLEVDVVMVGDLFYAPGLALRTGAFLDRCTAAGLEVWVGDPFRKPLPSYRLELVAEFMVADVGDGAAETRAGAFRWRSA